MKISVCAPEPASHIIRELLSPLNVQFTNLDEADVVIAYDKQPLKDKKTVAIPSDSADFMTSLQDVKVKALIKPGERVSVVASPQTVLTIEPQISFFYEGSVRSTPNNSFQKMPECNENLILLTLDVVNEYNRILDETLNSKSSTVYRLLTGLPIPYTLAPTRLRNLLMGTYGGKNGLTFCDRLQLDALRFVLANAIENISKKTIHRKMWNGKKYSCLITHDVETRSGLQKAKSIKKLEEKYNLPSAWYIPSERYKLNHETIKELANFGEVGAHDTTHDGGLSQLSERKLVKRLCQARTSLEKVINCSVKGFRAPLLQHNLSLLRGLKEAGYSYDTSIPTWEPKHPRTMCPHGVGTTYPISFGGVTEIPVSIVQDHQLCYTLGLEAKEAIATWYSMMRVIKELGSCCVFLAHPEYKIFDNADFAIYEEFLNTVVSDKQVWLATPKQLISEARQ